eukprot:gene10119-21088_t
MIFIVILLFSFAIIGTTRYSPDISTIFSSDLLAAHKIASEKLNDISSADYSGSADNAQPYFYCGSLADLKNTRQKLQTMYNVPASALRTAYVQKSTDTGCILTDLSIDTLSSNSLESSSCDKGVNTDDEIIMKGSGDGSSIGGTSFAENNPFESDSSSPSPAASVSHLSTRLIIEFSPTALASHNTQSLGQSVLASATSSIDSDTIRGSPGWDDILTNIVANIEISSSMNTNQKDQEELNEEGNVEVNNIENIADVCIAQLIQRAAASTTVLRILTSTQQRTQNFEVRGLIQTGNVGNGNEPYGTAGLTGRNQIVGIVDSGLNDLSCFLVDNSKAYSTINTDRTGKLQSMRRKVIQYISASDSLDYAGGHGTHVTTTIVGSSLYSHTDMNGIAPDAKVVFLDAGLNEYIGSLSVPELYETVFGQAYDSGVRVHTNSWKDGSNAYGTYSYDIDAFTTDNDDFIAVFAAGNTGGYGLGSVTAPSNAKNSISVGASEVRDLTTDELTDELTVAWFSGLGPTADGRFKPDIIAPGSFVMSGYAGSASTLQSSINSKSTSAQTSCAAITGVGTSMACPVVAGAALLIRQYFIDSAFWASICNTSFKQCRSGAFNPSGYLVKAVILHSGQAMHRYSTAEFDFKSKIDNLKLGNPPDKFQGYGSMLLKNVLPLLSGQGLPRPLDLIVYDAMEIGDYMTLTWTVTVDPYTVISSLKITLCWYDPPSAIGSSSKLLLHDLDLKVISPKGTVYWGNGINGGDESNPNEQVYISSATCENNACTYRVSVSAYVLSEGDSQKFAIIFTTSGLVSGYTSSKSSSSSTSSVTSSSLSSSSSDTNTLESEGTVSIQNLDKVVEVQDSIVSSSSSDVEVDVSTNTDIVKGSGTSSSSSSSTVLASSTSSLGSLSSSSSSSSSYSKRVIRIPSVALSITEKSNSYLQVSTVTLDSFYYSGSLHSLELNMKVQYPSDSISVGDQVDGFYPFIFSLLITAPNGYSTQVGGYNVYLAQDKFYQREWPRSWCTYHDEKYSYMARRELAVAGLTGTGTWT